MTVKRSSETVCVPQCGEKKFKYDPDVIVFQERSNFIQSEPVICPSHQLSPEPISFELSACEVPVNIPSEQFAVPPPEPSELNAMEISMPQQQAQQSFPFLTCAPPHRFITSCAYY